MKKIFRPVVTLFLVFGFATKLFAVGTPSVSGSISRGSTVSYFEFTIKITDVSQAELTSKEKDLFKDRIRVWLTDYSSASGEHVPFESDTQSLVVPFTITQKADLKKVPNSNNLNDFTYSVRITANRTDGLKELLKKGSNKVNLMVKYYEDTVEKTVLQSTSISVSTAIVRDAPINVASVGTHKAVVALWANQDTIAWSDGSSANKPSSIFALVIDKNTTQVNIPAFIFDSSSATGTDSEAASGTCQFNPSFVDGTSCINCSNSNAYLNPEKLGEMKDAGIFIGSSDDYNSSKISVKNLENDRNYALVMFYSPGGLNRSSCVTATPQENHTYSELNGENEADLKDPKCFIATAAYGSPLHKNLSPLRWFRDHVLLKSVVGQRFVSWYYQEGPKAAAIVAAHPGLALLVRAILWLPVMFLSLWMTLQSSHSFTTPFAVAAALLMIVVIGTWIRRRSQRGPF